MSNSQAGPIKSHLRTTIQRLGQLQQKKDSSGAITRRDIATLLKQGNVTLARTKTYNLILEDVAGDLLEKLEMYLGIILERVNEIEANAPTPNTIEAAATIIMAAPHVDSKDLHSIRDYLIQRLGLEFARSAMSNRDQHVSPKIAAAIASPPPSASKLDAVLAHIAQTYGIDWQPEPQRHDILPSLSEVLDPAYPFVDLARLRKLCSQGIPDEPSWIRPRIWKLLLGLVPSSNATSQVELKKQRDSYYDLVRRLLEPLSSFPQPTTSLMPQDDTILSVYRQLSRVPSGLFSHGLDEEPDATVVSCLDTDAPEELKILCSDSLDHRLHLLQTREKDGGDTQNKHDWNNNDTPEISLTAPESPQDEKPTRSLTKDSTTLVPSKASSSIKAHPKRTSALLRLLYIHASINPGNFSPHLPSLLVVLYYVINQEVEVADLAHAEADTFWLFEGMVGEFSELEDEEGGKVWMNKFGSRLNWADSELAENLSLKGLNPALPHYSYRWLAPLLTHTLPLSAVLPIWDAILARNMRERDNNPKLEFLVDVCTAMLIRVKGLLLRLGTAPPGRASGLWEDPGNRLPASPTHTWEGGGAFLEGMSLLELYPLDAAGGIDRIVQSAGDLSYQRSVEALRAQKTPTRSLGERLKVTMWRGFTNQEPSPLGSPASEVGDPLGHSPAGSPSLSPTISSRLASTVWRGITNQSSMEVPPSPMSPTSNAVFPRRSPRADSPISPPRSPSPPPPTPPEAGGTSIWQYAAQLRDSNAAAQLAKVSSNLKAKALIGLAGASNAASVPNTPQSSNLPSTPVRNNSVRRAFVPSSEPSDLRRGSLPIEDRSGLYSPPARPAYFRPPRDSVLPGSLQFPPGSVPTSPELRPQQEGLMNRARNLQETLSSLTRTTPASPEAPKAAPRPLLLGSSSVVGSKSPHARRVTDGSESGDWAEVMRAKSTAIHRQSQSSISSLSPSDALRRGSGNRSDWDSDGASRKVPLNRRSISPMAPNYRTVHSRPASSSSMSSSEPVLLSPPLPESGLRSQGTLSPASERGWGRIDIPDSPPVIVSPQPRALGTNLQDSAILSDATTVPLKLTDNVRRLARKKTPIKEESEAGETSEASLPAQPLARAQRIRSKRRPADIRTHAQPQPSATSGDLGRSPSMLQVDWPEEQVDLSATPTASNFDSFSPRSPKASRKYSGDSVEARQRKVSTEGRTRKISGSRPRKISTNKRESAAVEGDDEGYDDLLSAYSESEVPDDMR